MRKRSSLMVVMGVVAASLFLAVGLYAAASVPDTIKMDSPEYDKHKKGIVEFSHAKHIDDYKIGCGDCHHDKDGKPLENLKNGDEVQKCIDCHKKPGEISKDEKKAIKELSKEEQKLKKLEYHAEALHYNCRDCHREHNKANKTKDAPTSCTKCHPKKAK
jgi:hypothetical protein